MKLLSKKVMIREPDKLSPVESSRFFSIRTFYKAFTIPSRAGRILYPAGNG
jgi:hypothetical protein